MEGLEVLIKQLSVFVENKKGHLSAVTTELEKENIDIRAIAVFDTTEFGILRLVVDDPNKALDVLNSRGYVARVSKVLGVDPEDKPGGLNHILNILDENDISIEYIYSFVIRKKDRPLMIFKVSNQEKAIEALQKNDIKLILKEEIYK